MEESGDAEAHGLALLLKKLETVAAIYIRSEFVRACKQIKF